MLTHIQSYTVYVNDQDRAVDFFVNTLGFEKRADMSFGDMRWLEVAPPGAQTVLILAQGYGGWEASKVGQYTGLILDAGDLGMAYLDLAARGVEFPVEPSQQSWGMWAGIKDADGNMYFLSEDRNLPSPGIGRIHSATIYVNDLDAAVDFYTGKLGFVKRFEAPMEDGSRWIELELPGAETILIPVAGFSDWSPDKVGQFSRMVLATNDPQGDYERMAAAGVTFSEPPTMQPWGMLQALFTDQDGNGYVLVGPGRG